MAKGKSRQKGSGTRDPMESLTLGLRSQTAMTGLTMLDDLRAFDFEPDTRPARLLSGVTASVGATHAPKKNQAPSKVPYQIAFSAPAETLVCIRRKRRKEVLFAKRKTGRGGQRRARWSKWSNTKC